MPKNPNARTVSIPPEVQRAVLHFLSSKKGKCGNHPKNFSEVLVRGVHLLLNRNRTSVAKLAAMGEPPTRSRQTAKAN